MFKNILKKCRRNKIIINEDNQNITDIDLLKQYENMDIEEIIKK